MLLADMLRSLPEAEVTGATAIEISGVHYDSRRIVPGNLFVAIRGTHVDGHRFILQAVDRGAVAIVYDDRAALPSDLPAIANAPTLIAVTNSRAALAPLAAAAFRFPAHQLRVVGVTGTKGKTTTSTLCAHVLDSVGHRSGMISTANFKLGSTWSDNSTRQTTPEALEIQALLRRMVEDGCDYAVIEASSHALSPQWNRVGNCAFDIAVFTNVTHEHLDYHGTVEQYRRDKARLFQLLREETVEAGFDGAVDKHRKVAIVNLDDPHAGLFLEAAGDHVEVITYALDNPSAHVRARDVDEGSNGTLYTADTPWGEIDITIALPGRFNVLNSLAALSVGLAEGIPLEECAAALAAVHGVPGRMERVDIGQPFTVIVDYAHNPDSFEQVMSMMRELTSGKLISVFGSAGERDIQKRPLQGEIAGRYCDFVVVTDEDPRDEDSMVILEQIAAGVRAAGLEEGSGYLLVPDRAEALRSAFRQAQPGDIVLLLGKGHESCIVYEGGRKLPWNEKEEAERALRDVFGP